MPVASEPLNALPYDFDDASSCRIKHGKLGRSERLPGFDGRGILYGEAPGQIGRRSSRIIPALQNLRQFQGATSERRRRWLLRLRAEGPRRISLWAAHFGYSELPCILLVAEFLVLRAC